MAIKPDRRWPVVEFCLYLPGGVRAESVTNNGISTLCAALLTKGTRTRSAAQIARELDARGAHLTYEATRDAIRGTASCAPEDAAFMVALLAETALHSIFPESELEKQRRLCLGAAARLRDAWLQEALMNFNERFFAGHPYALPLAGSSNALTRLTRADVLAYHRALLQPSNIVLAIAGACDAQELLQHAARHLGSLSATAPPLPRAVSFQAHAPCPYVTVASPRNQATLVVGSLAPTSVDPDMPVYAVLRTMLGGLDGLVFHALRGTTNLAYVATGLYMSEPDAGALLALAQCAPRDVPLALVRITNVFATLAAGQIDETLLARARHDVITIFHRERQTLRAQAGDAARWLYRGQGLEHAEHFVTRAGAVTAQDIRNAAARMTGAWTCVVTTPQDAVARVQSFLRHYPGALPQDVYKMLVQGVQGPAHLAHDREMMEKELECEWESLQPADGELWQPVAVLGDWGWLNLRAWKQRGGSLAPVRRALWQSAHRALPHVVSVSQVWQAVVAATQAGQLPLDRQAVDEYDRWLTAHNFPVVHHSARFIELYRPSYRVLSHAAWEAALREEHASAASEGN